MVSRLASLASRLSAIQKSISAIEKEEGRKRWLESLEASRQVEKATRRAWSNLAMNRSGVQGFAYNPIRSSPLWQSHVVEDEQEVTGSTMNKKALLHPVMMMDMETVEEEEEDDMIEDEDEEMSDDDDVFSPSIIVRPISPLNASSLFDHSTSNNNPLPSVLLPAPTHAEYVIPGDFALLSSRRRSLEPPCLNNTDDSAPLIAAAAAAGRRPSLDKMDLSNYRIIPTAALDADDDGHDGLLDGMAGAQIHEIPAKSGEVGFRVGVAIAR